MHALSEHLRGVRELQVRGLDAPEHVCSSEPAAEVDANSDGGAEQEERHRREHQPRHQDAAPRHREVAASALAIAVQASGARAGTGARHDVDKDRRERGMLRLLARLSHEHLQEQQTRCADDGIELVSIGPCLRCGSSGQDVSIIVARFDHGHGERERHVSAVEIVRDLKLQRPPLLCLPAQRRPLTLVDRHQAVEGRELHSLGVHAGLAEADGARRAGRVDPETLVRDGILPPLEGIRRTPDDRMGCRPELLRANALQSAGRFAHEHDALAHHDRA
mmetsp:Transcript_28092/g.66838  ORF Transcript_28092/g.66838 Transcript_28092/m.66838 type:complete len:277 (+) Transcript_28092:601-1431(+)